MSGVERKVDEMHFTAINWLTGLAPTAAGAVAVLLLQAQSQSSRRTWLLILIGLLLFGFVMGTLTQLHALQRLGYEAKGQDEKARKSGRRRDGFQFALLLALYLSALTFFLGLICVPADESPSAPQGAGWGVVAAMPGPAGEAIVLSSADRKAVIVLRRKAPADAWNSMSYDATVSRVAPP